MAANEPKVGDGISAAAWCVAAAFGTYFCMYAFRKPFTAGTFTDFTLWGFGYKTVLVTAQVLGYTASKFLGIKVVSEVSPRRRAFLLLGLIGIAELALLLFALTPPPFNCIWLFCNGLPLGMVFGLVLGVLEGRRHTEALAAGLCTSFIVADGATKSAGGFLMQYGVSEFWMPFAAGLVFTPPFLIFVWMLSRVSPPTARDIAARSQRTPMDRTDRRRFFKRYAIGLTLLVLSYLLITVLRSVRADFAPEIWTGMGITDRPAIFTWSESIVAAVVTVLYAFVVLIRDNRLAFSYAMGLAITGPGLLVISLLGLHARVISPFAFMVLNGLGLYLPYIAVHTTLFERLMAMTRDRGNIGYLMYLADAFGYLGYVLVLLARNALGPAENFLSFFTVLSWVIAIACATLLIPCWYYFANHAATQRVDKPAAGRIA